MRLVANRDIREPDLAHIEAPFFACSKVRQFLLGGSGPERIFGIPNSRQYVAGLDYRQRQQKLLQAVEEGRWLLVIDSGPGPLRPPLRWQADDGGKGCGQWIVDESLAPAPRFNLMHAVARLKRESHRTYLPKTWAPEKFQISPINGHAWDGMRKRYANLFSDHNAYPQHLTAADEKGISSKLRNLYEGNDTIQNQADIEAYNNTPSFLGVTHGQIFDAMESVVTLAGLFEGGLALSRLKNAGKIAEWVSSRSHNRTNVDAIAPNKTNGGSAKSDPRGYLSGVETPRIPNQQGDYTCGPACGVAELKKYGIDISESELGNLAGTMNKYGTDPTRLAEALNKKIPSDASTTYRGGYLDNNVNNPEKVFDKLTENGQWIMQTNSGNYHYIVVDKIDDGIVTVLDPWRLDNPAPGNGMEATIPKDKLLAQWTNGDFGFIYPTNAKQR